MQDACCEVSAKTDGTEPQLADRSNLRVGTGAQSTTEPGGQQQVVAAPSSPVIPSAVEADQSQTRAVDLRASKLLERLVQCLARQAVTEQLPR